MGSILDYRGPRDTESQQRCVGLIHHEATICGRMESPFSEALMDMLVAWEQYAQAHEHMYESRIGDDPIIGDYWADVGLSIKRLLDGNCGGLDCGSIAQNITEAIESQGIATDG